jgi:hypothetical protein
MEKVKRTVIALLVAAALASAPAAANPYDPNEVPPAGNESRTGETIFFAALGATAAASATLFVYSLLSKRRARTGCAFTDEEVTITLSPDRVQTRGTYTFFNPADDETKLTLAYPFAAGNGMGPAENVAVHDEAGSSIPFAWGDGEISFDVAVPAGGRADVAVSFEQPCAADNFTYILTTARQWPKPLERAQFVVEAPASFGPVASTYPLERLAYDGAVVKYGFTREKFRPEEELTLSWKPTTSGD